MKIGELFGYLRLDDTAFSRGITTARRSMKELAEEIEDSAQKSFYLSRGLSALAPAAKAFSAVGLVPVLMGTASALAATNGALGLLPGVAFAAATGIGALKVGMSGFGEAMSNLDDPEKFAEALESLSPAARATASAIRDLVPAWQEMAGTVQETLFAGLAGKVSALAEDYLPMLGTSFGVVAGGANLAASGVLDMLNTTSRMDDIEKILGQSAGAWFNLLEQIAPVTAGMIDFGVVSTKVLGDLSYGLDGAGQRFADFMAQARESGQLEAWVRSGVEALGNLFAILGNVGALIGSVFRAANMDGAGLLVTVRELTAGWAQWAASAEGQARMAEVFTALKTILATTSGVLQTILPIIADLVVWFSQLPAPVQQAVVGFVVWGSIIGGVVGKLAPLLRIVKIIGTRLTAVGVKMIAAAAKWGLLGTAAKTAATATNASTLRIVGAWLRMAAGATANGARMALQWLKVAGPNAAKATAKMLAASGRIIARWAFMAAGAMARAAVMAASWLVAMGPIGWVIAAVVGLVALVIANWDKIKAWTIAAWNAVVSWITNAWNTIVSTVSSWIARAVAFVVNGWNRAKAVTSSAWSSLVSTIASWIARAIAWVAGIPDRVLAALSMLGSLLVGLGGDLVDGLWRGIKAGWAWLKGKVADLAGQLLDVAKAALGIGSPSKEFRDEVGRWIPEGFADGIIANASVATDAARTMAADAAAAARAEAARSAPPQLSGLGKAAQAVLGRLNSGRRVFEDLSWRGNPDVVGRHNDRLLNMADARGVDTNNPAAMRRFLASVVTAQSQRSSSESADMRQAVADGVRSGVNGARLNVDGRGVARLVNRQNANDQRLGGTRIPQTATTRR